MIAEFDSMIGKLIKTLEEINMRDNTYIIFTGDHGEMAGEQNQILKRTMYEPSTHIPLIISGPGVNSSISYNTPVSLIDLLFMIHNTNDFLYFSIASTSFH